MIPKNGYERSIHSDQSENRTQKNKSHCNTRQQLRSERKKEISTIFLITHRRDN